MRSKHRNVNPLESIADFLSKKLSDRNICFTTDRHADSDIVVHKFNGIVLRYMIESTTLSVWWYDFRSHYDSGGWAHSYAKKYDLGRPNSLEIVAEDLDAFLDASTAGKLVTVE